MTDKPSQNWLRRMYVGDGKSKTSIAKRLNVRTEKVSEWLDEHDIERRYKREDWMREMLVDRRLGVSEVAKRTSTSKSTVRNWAKKFGLFEEREYRGEPDADLPTGREHGPDPSEVVMSITEESDVVCYPTGSHTGKFHDWTYTSEGTLRSRCDMTAQPASDFQFSTRAAVEDHYEPCPRCFDVEEDSHRVVAGVDSRDVPDDAYRRREWLERLCREEGLSKYEIAELCDVHHATVQKWLARHDLVPRR